MMGVRNRPIRLPITALSMAVEASASAAVERVTHILMVVGRASRDVSPIWSAFSLIRGYRRLLPASGRRRRLKDWTRRWRRHWEEAWRSWEGERDSPLKKKMRSTPTLLIQNSGFKPPIKHTYCMYHCIHTIYVVGREPPVLPREGLNLASIRTKISAMKNQFLSTRAVHMKGGEGRLEEEEAVPTSLKEALTKGELSLE